MPSPVRRSESNRAFDRRHDVHAYVTLFIDSFNRTGIISPGQPSIDREFELPIEGDRSPLYNEVTEDCRLRCLSSST